MEYIRPPRGRGGDPWDAPEDLSDDQFERLRTRPTLKELEVDDVSARPIDLEDGAIARAVDGDGRSAPDVRSAPAFPSSDDQDGR